ncbi:hypothetical protein F5880DRAFT_390234 [Lentinula raphanica]|nr:hypothetical protein F5880DRAFT_390234 [Lentinula raphanica]
MEVERRQWLVERPPSCSYHSSQYLEVCVSQSISVSCHIILMSKHHSKLFLIVFNDAATHRRHKFATGGAWRSIGQILGHFIVRTNLCGPWGMSLYLRRADNLSQWTAHSIDFIVSRDVAVLFRHSIELQFPRNQGGHFTFSDERKLPWNSNAFDFESVFRQRKSICMISQVGELSTGLGSLTRDLLRLSAHSMNETDRRNSRARTGLLPAVAAAAHGRYMVASIRMVLDL